MENCVHGGKKILSIIENLKSYGPKKIKCCRFLLKSLFDLKIKSLFKFNFIVYLLNVLQKVLDTFLIVSMGFEQNKNYKNKF